MTAPAPAEVLRIEGLTVSLKATGQPTVADLSLAVRAGETLCVVGESGSGKSVTSLAVMGLLDPAALAVTAGRITVDGEDVLAASPEQLRRMRATRMSMVFQEPMTALNPVETVGAQVEEVLKVHGIGDAAARRRQVLEMFASVHLPNPERIHASYPHQLSGGQRQRIVISMALILRPKLLIADEPTTALDVTTQRQILLLIRELQERFGTAVLFITHDFGVVSEIADRIVVMNRGRMVEIGSRDDVLARPSQSYTRMLVASVPSLVPPERAPGGGSEVLTVAGLAKSYGQTRGLGGILRRKAGVAALHPTDMRLARGEILGIVGESGSGKTTLARCIMRLVPPSSGSIRLDGTEIAGLSNAALRPHRRRLQIVFQDPFRSLNARMRVRDLIAEGPLNFGVSREAAYARAGELLERVGLSREMLGRFPHQFSGGQRQRIAIARALALEPDVLVADESVSALDVSVQSQVLALLRGICDESGVGILFITHDLRVAAQICDRIAVMRRGEVVETGTAAAVLAAPTHPYTRELIAAAPGRGWNFAEFRAEPQAAAL
ncbi:dipeptide ABC transporter ATP-binding protein [Methylobacterium frigidaeris]|uniref:Glutathione import ATP-binding protein GsiA n=1 Tax=Methylobacterium frigidaeris TaxID=2038277 RepID=A0AA37M662_9HYPH|nr:ABC transporter ATP-binding protein [Methylobacterium frigidaeris]PIK70830.1 microcin ABC transporter ATP-binding protein [Methylobacterium frigidaeris]GJD64313.1 Glutathione import ATP-binding protein GsiA [Methylobacterium frigidaeris]